MTWSDCFWIEVFWIEVSWIDLRRCGFTPHRPCLPHAVAMLDALTIACPYCGETFDALVDASAGDADYIEDCAVCCRPILMRLRVGSDGELSLDAGRDS